MAAIYSSVRQTQGRMQKFHHPNNNIYLENYIYLT